MEVEAKFTLTRPLEASDVEAVALGPYRLRPASEQTHEDTLLDTASRAITGSMHAVRIRATDGAMLLTFKGPNTGQNSLHVREEIEAPLSADAEATPWDYTLWPEPISQRVADLAQGAPLEPLLHLRVTRRLWMIRRGNKLIGELALDNGEIIAANRHAPLREIEIELKGAGTQTDIDTLSQLFADSLPIVPEPRSKLERGLVLLRHARWTLDGYTPMESIARHMVRRRLRALRRAEMQLFEAASPDAIHDMRVAARRIRTILAQVEGAGIVEDDQARMLRKRLGAVARDLGAVRDLDILMDLLHEYTQTASQSSDEAIQTLRADIAQRRSAKLDHLLKRLRRSKYQRLMGQLEVFVSTPAMPPDGEPCVQARHFAGSALWPRYDTLTRYDTLIHQAAPATLHRIRIASKRLRYALELFRPVLKEDIAPLRKALVTAQNHLGSLQDLTVAIDVVSKYASDHGRSDEYAPLIADLRGDRENMLKSTPAVWANVCSPDSRQALSQAIANL